MKTGKKLLVFLMIMVLALSLLAVNGCKKISDEDETAAVTSVVDSVQLCSHCGHVKGSDLCCKPGQEKCPKCGLVKGSPGCCKIPK